MIDALIKVVIAYLLGSIMGSLVLGRLFGGLDVRSAGSRNAGATNAWRTRGAKFGLSVFVIDMAKGVVAVLAVPLIVIPGLSPAPIQVVALACGVAVVLGHLYPIFFGFKGGKGAATLVGVYLSLLPHAMPFMLAVWVVSLVLSGFVGLSTMLGAWTAAVFIAATNAHGLVSAQGLFVLLMGCLVTYTHRANIGRMLRREENRFEKVMILRRLVSRT